MRTAKPNTRSLPIPRSFGFSVSKAQKLLQCGAYDSMLAVSVDGITYHPRYGCESMQIGQDSVRSVWKPLPGVTIETEIIASGSWHIRKHRIHNEMPVTAAEGAFAVGTVEEDDHTVQRNDQSAVVFGTGGISGIRAITGYQKAVVIRPEPNTNLMSQRTLLPMLTADLEAGSHQLVCAVLGSASRDPDAWENIPREVSAFV